MIGIYRIKQRSMSFHSILIIDIFALYVRVDEC